MEPQHIVLIILGAVVALNLIKRWLNPPKPVTMEELPTNVRAEFEQFGDFEIEKIIFEKSELEYKFYGSCSGEPARVEVELNRSREIREVEFNVRSKLKKPGQFISDKTVPQSVAEIMFPYLGDEAQSFELTRINSCEIRNEPAFDVKGRTANWKWEFEICESGKLYEMEKEKLRA